MKTKIPLFWPYIPKKALSMFAGQSKGNSKECRVCL